jgi:ABC-type transporter Mla subunit MlaD
MTLHSHKPRREKSRGSAVLVVLVLLGIMALYLMGNSVTLHNLRVDMRVVEAKQLRRYREPVAVAGVTRLTNEVSGVTPGTPPPGGLDPLTR